MLDILTTQPGAFYVMYRGYVDFARLNTMHMWIAVSVLVAIIKNGSDSTTASTQFTDFERHYFRKSTFYRFF
jgi:hypothetical protein